MITTLCSTSNDAITTALNGTAGHRLLYEIMSTTFEILPNSPGSSKDYHRPVCYSSELYATTSIHYCIVKLGLIPCGPSYKFLYENQLSTPETLPDSLDSFIESRQILLLSDTTSAYAPHQSSGAASSAPSVARPARARKCGPETCRCRSRWTGTDYSGDREYLRGERGSISPRLGRSPDRAQLLSDGDVRWRTYPIW
jgi:hypothetical protein